MKKLLFLFCALVVIGATVQTTIKMKTSKAVGEEFSFTVDPDLECIVDWGNGKPDTIVSTLEPICGTLTGSNITLKTSGLTYFDCSEQMISQLTFSAATKLETLIISNNKLISCNMNSLTNLKTLWCDHNTLASVDFSKMTNLQSLIASNNYLSKVVLPTTGQSDITDLWVNSNRITSLDLTTCRKLKTLNVENNSMKSMTLTPQSEKVTAVFMDGNALDFTSLWNKISVSKWYGTTQNIPFSSSTYKMGEEFSLGRDLVGINQDRQELGATTFTYTWYPYTNGVKGNKLVRGDASSQTCDYSTPNTSTQKHLFTFNRAFDDLQLEIKCNKYINFLIVTNHIAVEDPTAVKDASALSALSYTVKPGAIVLEADVPTEVKIYNTAGVLCWQGTVQNPIRVQLAKGVYVVNNKKVSI